MTTNYPPRCKISWNKKCIVLIILCVFSLLYIQTLSIYNSANMSYTTVLYIHKGEHDHEDNTQRLKPLSFIHIPKTGGTTIEQIARYDDAYQWGAEFWKAHKQKRQLSRAICRHHKSKCCCQWMHHMPPIYLHDISKQYSHFEVSYYDLNKQSLFTVVRNPFARLISEYWWQARQPRPRLEIITHFESIDVWNNSTTFCDIKIFNEWIKFRLKKHTNRKDKNVYNLFENECKSGCHLIPQWRYTHFINGSLLMPYENILHTETLAIEFNSLMKRYNVSFHMEASHHIKKRKTKQCELLKPSVIDEEAMKLVLNAYKKKISFYLDMILKFNQLTTIQQICVGRLYVFYYDNFCVSFIAFSVLISLHSYSVVHKK
eukprot:314363_1